MIACFLSNIFAKYYKNPSMFSRVIAKNVGDVFFETQCICDISRPQNYKVPTTDTAFSTNCIEMFHCLTILNGMLSWYIVLAINILACQTTYCTVFNSADSVCTDNIPSKKNTSLRRRRRPPRPAKSSFKNWLLALPGGAALTTITPINYAPKFFLALGGCTCT